MQIIQIDPELSASIEALRETTEEDIQKVIQNAANEAVRAVLRQITERKLIQEQQAFEEQHAKLAKTHLGQYVAFHNSELIDSDDDERALYIRVHQEHPNAVIGIFPVRESSEMRVHRFTGSRIHRFSESSR